MFWLRNNKNNFGGWFKLCIEVYIRKEWTERFGVAIVQTDELENYHIFTLKIFALLGSLSEFQQDIG